MTCSCSVDDHIKCSNGKKLLLHDYFVIHGFLQIITLVQCNFLTCVAPKLERGTAVSSLVLGSVGCKLGTFRVVG